MSEIDESATHSDDGARTEDAVASQFSTRRAALGVVAAATAGFVADQALSPDRAKAVESVTSVNTKTGAVSLPALNTAGELSSSLTAGGATTGNLGRTSTIVAPVLRDVVSILDFAEASSGNGSSDDTAIFQAAVTAVGTAGGGTLVVTPLNPKGEPASWKLKHVVIADNVTISAYGANFSVTGEEEGALFGDKNNGGEKGKIQHKNFRLYGGIFNGTGLEKPNQGCFAAWRAEDFVIRDMKVTNWGKTNLAGPIFFADSHRIRVEGNTLVGCCGGGGQNAINFSAQTFGEATTPYTEILITNNIVTGGGAAPICVQLQLSNQYVNTVPDRIVIANNICETTTSFAAIAIEIGGGAGSEYPKSSLEQIIITNNVCTMTGSSGSGAGIFVNNDSSPERLTSATLFADIKIANNIVESGRNGITTEGSRITIENNTITAANHGIFCRGVGSEGGGTTGPPINAATHVHVKGGSIRMKGAGAGGTAGVFFNLVTDSSIDTDVFYANGAEGESKGVFLKNCTRVDLNARVSFAPRQGILVEGGGNILINPGTRVYNPASQTATAGIQTTKVVGPVWVRGAHVRDDRGGSATMTYGLSNESPETGGVVYSLNNVFLGYTKTAPWNGTITTQLNDVIDETGVIWTGRRRETWGTAAPTTGSWTEGDKCWNTKPTTTTSPAFWMCITAGTPGTWQECKL